MVKKNDKEPMFNKLKQLGFEVETYHHAEAILTHDMPGAAQEIEGVLSNFKINVENLVKGGGH